MSIFEESKSYRPFKYPRLVELTKTHSIDMHWHEGQVVLQDDLMQYNTKGGLATKNVSSDVNKYVIDSTLCLFTELDKVVAQGYASLIPHANNNEVRNWFLTVSAREVIHQRAYALGAETFGFSEDDWSAFRDYVEMQGKIDVMTADNGDLSEPLNFAKSLAQLLLGEGIGLFAAFTTLLNFKRHGLLVGFNDVNVWSLADETDHVAGNILVLDAIRKEDLTEAENIDLNKFIEECVERYVEAEKLFIDLLFVKGDCEDLTSDELKEYIDYLGDLRRYQLGLLSVGSVRKNPLPWVEIMLGGVKQVNFFEQKVTDYNHGGLTGKVDYSRYKTLIGS